MERKEPTKSVVTLRMSEEMHLRVRSGAKAARKSINQFLLDIVEKHLDESGIHAEPAHSEEIHAGHEHDAVAAH
jgi:predicted DNA-binding protein